VKEVVAGCVIGWKLWERKKKDGQREETAAGFWFQREKEKEGAQFFFQREGKGGCLAKEEREMGAAGDDGGLIRGWQRRRKMGEPTGK
jgi:hypothetical protein